MPTNASPSTRFLEDTSQSKGQKLVVVDGHDSDDEASLDIRACALCHCALDYSDRAAFFSKDRKEDYSDAEDDDNDHTTQDSYFYQKTDPYLPVELYDPQNALVYCDHCDRLYHQRCHFVPIIVLPRGSWVCLFCQSMEKSQKLNIPKKRKYGPSGRKQLAESAEKSSSKRTRKANSPATSADPLVEFFNQCPATDRLFQSPPYVAMREDEARWETAARFVKASTVQQEFGRKIQTACAVQWSNYRLAVTALETLTTTSKNRKHFTQTYKKNSRVSQELADGFVKYTSAKCKLRELVVQLDRIRCATDESWVRLVQWIKEEYPSYNPTHSESTNSGHFVNRVLFPFGMHHPRRVEPRTPEMSLALQEKQQTKAIPAEIHLAHKARAGSLPDAKAARNNDSSKSKTKTKAAKSSSRQSDYDCGISLDELTCCICFTGEATDENDLLMCDGRGCYRAYHMKCVKPEVTPQDIEDEDNDWFCPLCSAFAQLMLTIQTEFMGDEWEQRRYALEIEGKPTDGSVKSWESVSDVFPEAPTQFEAALQLRKGQRTAATDDLLATVVGLEEFMPNNEADDEEDNEDEDGHFDLTSYTEERRRYREEIAAGNPDSDDDDVNSSQATLVEMSSVELEIKADELAALSDESVDANVADSEGGGRVRRSRRLTQRAIAAEGGDSDPGQLDAANIMVGKRDRKPVDYIRLNEAIFGDLSEGELANLDDTEEFRRSRPRKSGTTSSNNSDSKDNENDSTDSDGDKHSSDEEASGVGRAGSGRNKSSGKPINARGGARGNRTTQMKTRGGKSKGTSASGAKKQQNGNKNGVHQLNTPRNKKRRRVGRT